MIESKQINWFPGHMAKATKNIQQSIKNVDLIIEVVDARAINATSNKDFASNNKPLLKVALKSDLADTHTIKYDSNLIVGSTKDVSFRKTLINKISEMLKPTELKKKAKGFVKPTFLVMIVGLPNVGKSSLINFLAKKNIAAVGNRPAVTKNQANIKLTDTIYLQDNPGVFFKNVKSLEEGCVLALLNTIKKEILPLDEVIKFAYNYLIKYYPNLLYKKYSSSEETSYEEFKTLVAKQRNFVKAGGQPDIDRTLNVLFDDIVNGQIGKINYEK